MGEMERRAYRRTVEELLDLALRLRGELARDTAPPAVEETVRRVRELKMRAARQRAELLDRDEATAVVLEERLRHALNILAECDAILAGRPPGPPGQSRG